MSLERHPFATSTYATAAARTGEVACDIAPWQAALLVRPIPGTDLTDASGCYPYLPFGAHADLAGGLKRLRDLGLVSVVLVTDPLHPPPFALDGFDFSSPYKTHYIFDRALGPLNTTRRNWREVRIARKALRISEVSYATHAEDFARLYDNLVSTRSIVGPAAPGQGFFASLKNVPGIRTMAAWFGETLVSMMLFVVYNNTGYSFLAGTTAEGRAHCAHYGLYANAIESFTDLDLINLGGVPGVADNPSHGIAHVKRKLSNSVRHSYLCGAILNPAKYDGLCRKTALKTSYFPIYRAPILEATQTSST